MGLHQLPRQQGIIDLFVYQQLSLLHQMVTLEIFGFNIQFNRRYNIWQLIHQLQVLEQIILPN
jgi:hypothetical protein